ncbi:MAG: HAMP domain-containing sensor histidine kinase [Eubacteriales bacterium]|nr:HAMP domain-containing sensor histidine kinase [Eubacteriales bacterium]
MKERWYRRNWVKILWIALEHILLTAALVCGIFLIDQYNRGNLPADVKEKLNAETEGFAQQIHEMSADILYGIQYQQWTKTKNEDGSSRLLDLQEVYEGKEYTYKNTSGLAYRMSDLKDWAAGYDSYDNAENILVCKKADGTYDYYYAQEFLNLIDKKSLKFIVDKSYGDEDATIFNIRDRIQYRTYEEGNTYGLQGVANKKGEIVYVSIWSFYGESIQEKYAPDGADSILDVVNKNPNWNGRLQEAYQALDLALQEMSNAVFSSKLEQYTEGNTNLTYLYVDQKNRKVYTNKEDYASYKTHQAALAAIRETGAYVIVKPKLSQCETTMNTDLREWQDFVRRTAPEGLTDCIFAVGVDTTYPIEDELAIRSRNYEKYSSWLIPVIVVMCVCLVLWLAGLAILTPGAGRKEGDGELHLIWFDRIFTEIAAGGLLFLECLLLCVPVAVWENYSRGLFPAFALYASVVVFALGSCAMFLLGYLSLVRRIKGKTLWKNSFLLWFWRFVKKAWRRARVFLEQAGSDVQHGRTLKMVSLFGAFLVAQMFLVSASFGGGSFFCLLLLLALDGIAFWYFVRRVNGQKEILEGLKKITDGDLHYKIPCEKLIGEQKTVAEAINSIGAGLDAAVENSLKNERMKTELITNVSHDIKTPLTSIINYVDLLKRENLSDPKIVGYLDILDAKAQRLKILTEDVVEASKASTGNITLEMTNLNLVEMLHQVIGEFQEKMEEKNLKLMLNLPEEPVMIYADGRRMWRVLANIFNNTAKYAMEGTRVYVDLKKRDGKVSFSLKNISAEPLNISADELTERFIRGDGSRSTEGSGLGLSIAKSLTELQKGEFQVYLDGDLFKVMIVFSQV